MAKKPIAPAPKPVQQAADILDLEASTFTAWREHTDEDGALLKVVVITGQGQKFSFTPEQLANTSQTQADLKKRKVKIFKSLPHGPNRLPPED